jgi:hypothetical protein
MTTIVRCPRTGRACSEPTCQERHWRRKMFEHGLNAAFASLLQQRVGALLVTSDPYFDSRRDWIINGPDTVYRDRLARSSRTGIRSKF